MTYEIRVPTAEELPRYYRALPYAVGLPHWEPAPAAWHGGPEAWPPPRHPATDEQLREEAEHDAADESFHPVAAFDGDQVVGGSATLSMQVTVPGGHQLAIEGVTATGVIATHRRRGLLRTMMQHMFDAAVGRGVCLMLLSASEGSIYGRYGFCPATYRVRWEILRSQAQLLPSGDDQLGSLELVDAAHAKAVWPQVHRQVRANRVGELSPQASRWDGLHDNATGTDGPMRYLLHRSADGVIDGVANFRLPWSADPAHAGQLVVEALEAATDEAYRALWSLLLDFDLTRTVIAPGRPHDEPLRWMLTDARAMRITRQSDNMWARLLDVGAAFSARGYELSESLTFEVVGDSMLPANNGVWQLNTDGRVGVCERGAGRPDLVIELAALSALYLGGMSAHDFMHAGHIQEVTPGAVGRLSRLLRVDPEPHNSFGF